MQLRRLPPLASPRTRHTVNQRDVPLEPGNEWVPGYEGRNSVSATGEVRSWQNWRGRKPGWVVPQYARGRYLCVHLWRDGQRRCWAVHRLVLLAFLKFEGIQARHLNGDPHDNRLSNLAWGTPAQNAQDKHHTGTYWIRDAVLTEAAVRAIYQSCAMSCSLATWYGVSEATISLIKSRKNWARITVGLGPPGRPARKLTADAVMQIRRSNGKESTAAMARRFGVSAELVRGVRNGKFYGTGAVTPPPVSSRLGTVL